MPIAFKEWSVTVRALAEGEQLLTLRKGGIREENKHFELEDPRIVDSLSPFHIWTQDYARKRLAWKRTHPLHVLLLKVHRIPRPVTVRVRDEHHGCHSWVEIDRELPFEGVPVMADEEFDRAVARPQRGRLGRDREVARAVRADRDLARLRVKGQWPDPGLDHGRALSAALPLLRPLADRAPLPRPPIV